LGAKEGIEELKGHRFFKKYKGKWDNLRNMIPPLKPDTTFLNDIPTAPIEIEEEENELKSFPIFKGNCCNNENLFFFFLIISVGRRLRPTDIPFIGWTFKNFVQDDYSRPVEGSFKNFTAIQKDYGQ